MNNPYSPNNNDFKTAESYGYEDNIKHSWGLAFWRGCKNNFIKLGKFFKDSVANLIGYLGANGKIYNAFQAITDEINNSVEPDISIIDEMNRPLTSAFGERIYANTPSGFTFVNKVGRMQDIPENPKIKLSVGNIKLGFGGAPAGGATIGSAYSIVGNIRMAYGRTLDYTRGTAILSMSDGTTIEREASTQSDYITVSGGGSETTGVTFIWITFTCIPYK